MKVLDTAPPSVSTVVTQRVSNAVQRYLPDPFVIAIGLTVVVFAMAMLIEGTGPIETVRLWGEGLWTLLSFSMQVTVLLLTGYMLANTPVVQRLLDGMSSRVTDPRVAVALACFIGLLGAWFNAGLGMVLGTIIAQRLACHVRGMHFPLAVAGGYAGFCIYGIGVSGTVPLSIATPGHPLEPLMGVAPLSATVFHPVMLGTSILVAIALPLFVALLHPRTPELVTEADPATLPAPAGAADAGPRPEWFSDRLSHSRAPGWVMGLIGLTYSVVYVADGGAINFDSINALFLFLCLLLYGRPVLFLKSLRESTPMISAVLVQYPMYAGIMGIMGILAGSGLMITFAGVFVATSSAETLPFFSFISGGVINILAPSTGAQWAIQGPVMVEAAQQMGADIAATSMGVAMGDQWTNAIQPLWILPALAISGIKLRDAMIYLLYISVFLGVIYGGAMLLWGFTA
ncbi:short-chain fatty acid transporter [Kocuria sp. M1R5S2]|uniref:short-chain fatty acid transporter n=1 Tax=Kocuria rhizosphaerae TaxID=3376285 RepID=UPI0037A58B31